MRRAGGSFWLVAFAMIVMALAPNVAEASWGKKTNNGEQCSQGNGHHCYAFAEWYMTGTEQVEGTSVYEYTTDAEVPAWNTGDFFTQEEWVSFHPSEYWVETGQIAGYKMDCCKMHPFYAWDNASGFYINPSKGFVPWDENELYQVSGQNHNGTWCPYWGKEQKPCTTGYYDYSNRLIVGTEIGANTKPVDDGEEGVNAWWSDSTHNWQKEARYVDGGLCAGRNSHAEAFGNIWFATC